MRKYDKLSYQADSSQPASPARSPPALWQHRAAPNDTARSITDTTFFMHGDAGAISAMDTADKITLVAMPGCDKEGQAAVSSPVGARAPSLDDWLGSSSGDLAASSGDACCPICYTNPPEVGGGASLTPD